MNGSVVRCPRCGRKNRVPAARAGVPRCAACGAALPWIVDASDDDFAQVAAQGALAVLVDLWAEWCAPCRHITPIVERLGREMAGKVKVVKVDVDRSPRTASRFGVRGVPTVLLLREGRELDDRGCAAGGADTGPRDERHRGAAGGRTMRRSPWLER